MADSDVEKNTNQNNNQDSTTSSIDENRSAAKSKGSISEYANSLVRGLILSILPLFFGSFLFAGLIEDYKDDVSFRKSIIYDAYRPMREIYTSCQATHNKLFLKYAEVAGSYQLLFDEIEHMLKAMLAEPTSNNETLLVSMNKAFNSATKDLTQLEQDQERCRSKLFRAYEELALMTGTYDNFRIKAKNRSEKLNKLYALRQQRLQQNTNGIEVPKLMQKLRKVVNLDDFSSEEEMKRLVNEFRPIATVVIKSNFTLSKTEEEIFKVENQFYDDLHEMFVGEINSRFKRGFVSWIL